MLSVTLLYALSHTPCPCKASHDNLRTAHAQAIYYIYLLTSVCAAAWAPLIGFILLERKNRFSVSQWGPALMGFADATRYLVLFLAFLALYLGVQQDDPTVLARVYQVPCSPLAPVIQETP